MDFHGRDGGQNANLGRGRKKTLAETAIPTQSCRATQRRGAACSAVLVHLPRACAACELVAGVGGNAEVQSGE